MAKTQDLGSVLGNSLFAPLIRNAAERNRQTNLGSVANVSKIPENVAQEEHLNLVDSLGGPGNFQVKAEGGIGLNDKGRQYVAQTLSDPNSKNFVNLNEFISSSPLFEKAGVDANGLYRNTNVLGLTPLNDGSFAVDLEGVEGAPPTVATSTNNADPEGEVTRLDIDDVIGQFNSALQRSIVNGANISPGISSRLSNVGSEAPGSFDENITKQIQLTNNDRNIALDYIQTQYENGYISAESAADVTQSLKSASSKNEIGGLIAQIQTATDKTIGADRVTALSALLPENNSYKTILNTPEIAQTIAQAASKSPEFNNLMETIVNTGEEGVQKFTEILARLGELDDKTIKDAKENLKDPENIYAVPGLLTSVTQRILPEGSYTKEQRVIETLVNPDVMKSVELVTSLYKDLPERQNSLMYEKSPEETKNIISELASRMSPEETTQLADVTLNDIKNGNFLKQDGSAVTPESGYAAMLENAQNSKKALQLVTITGHTLYPGDPQKINDFIKNQMSIYDTGVPTAVAQQRLSREESITRNIAVGTNASLDKAAKIIKEAEEVVGAAATVNSDLTTWYKKFVTPDEDPDDDSDTLDSTEARLALGEIQSNYRNELGGKLGSNPLQVYNSTISNAALMDTSLNIVLTSLISKEGPRYFGSVLKEDNPLIPSAYSGVGLLFEPEVAYTIKPNGRINISEVFIKDTSGNITDRSFTPSKINKEIPRQDRRAIQLGFLMNTATPEGPAIKRTGDGKALEIYDPAKEKYVPFKG